MTILVGNTIVSTLFLAKRLANNVVENQRTDTLHLDNFNPPAVPQNTFQPCYRKIQ